MMRLRIACLAAVVLAACVVVPRHADAQATVVSSCGAQSLTVGKLAPTEYITPTGLLCVSSSGGSGGTVNQGTQAASATGSTWFVQTSPTARTIVPLDVSTVTTGGTAVAALSAGHKTAGGFLQNPPSATVNLCINEAGTASGTTSAASTTCIVPGQSYALIPSTGAVSVISSDSSHPFSGYGLQ